MNITVEATPKIEDLQACEILIISKQLLSLLHHITISGNREALMLHLHKFDEQVSWANESHHFHWGFVGRAMWVKQRGNDKQLLSVYIINEYI